MMNADNRIYTPFKFVLPSLSPEYSLSSYMVRWAAEIEALKVTLRQSIRRGRRATVESDAQGAYSTLNGDNEHDSKQPGSPWQRTPISLSKVMEGRPSEYERNISGVVEEPIADSVCGVEEVWFTWKNLDAKERSTTGTCDEPLFRIPLLDAATWEPSYILASPPISFALNTLQKPKHLKRTYLNEAIESVRSIKMPSSICQSSAIDTHTLPSTTPPSAMEIDLDAAFDGQGVLDLDDEEVSLQASNDIKKVTAAGQDVDDVLSYAKWLLESKRKGLPLSHFIPDESETNDFLKAALEHSGLPHDDQGARRAASEVAYYYFYKGLDTLRDQGFVVSPCLVEVDRSKDWFFALPDGSGKIPSGPPTYESEPPTHGIAVANEFKTSHDDTRFEHFNFLRNLVQFRSETPAAVSLYIQMSCNRKVGRDPLSREGVILSQATKYIDPVSYDGPQEHLLLEGTAFRDRVTGYVVKVNDHAGTFGDLFDGETAIKSQNDICQYYLANQWQQDQMQHPYIMDIKGHASSGRGDLNINASDYCPPKNSFYRRDTAGRLIYWNDGVTPKPAYIPSKLSSVETVEYGVDAVDTSGPLLDAGLSIGINKKDEQEMMTEQAEEEYSPFSPCIPGLTATNQESQPEETPDEMSDEEAVQHVDELFATLAAVVNGHQESASTKHIENAQPAVGEAFSTVNVPLSSVKFTNGPTGEQHNKTKVDTLTLEAQPMTRGSSISSSDYKGTSDDEDYRSSGATTPEYAALSTNFDLKSYSPEWAPQLTLLDTEDPPSLPDSSPPPYEDNDSSKGENSDNGGPYSQYAGIYASFVFGFAIAASFLW